MHEDGFVPSEHVIPTCTASKILEDISIHWEILKEKSQISLEKNSLAGKLSYEALRQLLKDKCYQALFETPGMIFLTVSRKHYCLENKKCVHI